MKKEDSYIMLLLAIIILTIIVYIPIFSNDLLISWDDQWMVINHFTEGGWTLNNLKQLFTGIHGNQYSPIIELNYMLIYSICGYNPAGYHIASLMWHLSCIILVFVLINKLMTLKNETRQTTIRTTFITTLLFAIHPVNVESVAWASAAKVVIFAFFYLLAILLYIYYTQTKKLKYFTLSLVSFLISCLSKEQAITLPLCLILVDWYINRNLINKNIWIEKLPFFIVTFAFGILILSLQGTWGKEMTGYTFGQRVLFGCYTLFEYITKSMLPIKLNYLYPYPIPTGNEQLPTLYFTYPILTLCLIGWIYMQRHKQWLLFGSLFFLLHIVMMLHIVQMPRYTIVADRYLYLSLIGCTFILSNILLKFKLYCKSNSLKRACNIFFAIYCCYFASYTYSYSRRWKDNDTVKQYLREFLELQKKNEIFVEEIKKP